MTVFWITRAVCAVEEYEFVSAIGPSDVKPTLPLAGPVVKVVGTVTCPAAIVNRGALEPIAVKFNGADDPVEFADPDCMYVLVP